MRAIRVTRLDGPDSLKLADLPDPQADGDKVLVSVHNAGVNFPDLLMTRGQYQIKPEMPFVPGSEIAGTVIRGGTLAPGTRVAGFSGLGGFADTALCAPDALFTLPDNIDFQAGAALPMNYLTMEFALHHRARLQPGQTVLVQGAAGGIGVASVQLAKVLGARVIAVVSSEKKAEVARRAGADEVVLADGFLTRVKDLGGADVVVDPVGGDRFTDSLRCLNPEGKLLVLGFTAGAIPEVKVNRLLLNNISVVGVGWGSWWSSRRSYLQEQWNRLLPHLAAGTLSPLIGNVYPLAHAAEALRELEERRALAKVVLDTRESS